MTKSNKKDTELKVHAVEDIHVSDYVFTTIEIRISGLYGQPYIDAAVKLKSKFKQAGVILDVFLVDGGGDGAAQMSSSASVLIEIKKIGKSLAIPIIMLLLGKCLDIQCADPPQKGSNAKISIQIEQTNNFYNIHREDTALIEEDLKKLDEESKGERREAKIKPTGKIK